MTFFNQIMRLIFACVALCLLSFIANAMNVDPNTEVTLQGCDSEKTYTISSAAAQHSGTIQDLIESCGTDHPIPLPDVSNDMLREYIVPALKALNEGAFDLFVNEKLIDISEDNLIEIINTASYLDIEQLESKAGVELLERLSVGTLAGENELSQSTQNALHKINHNVQIKMAVAMLSPYAFNARELLKASDTISYIEQAWLIKGIIQHHEGFETRQPTFEEWCKVKGFKSYFHDKSGSMRKLYEQELDEKKREKQRLKLKEETEKEWAKISNRMFADQRAIDAARGYPAIPFRNIPTQSTYTIDFNARSGEIYNSLSAAARELIDEKCNFIEHKAQDQEGEEGEASEDSSDWVDGCTIQ